MPQDFIPRECLRLNSPYMVQLKDNKTDDTKEVEKVAHILKTFDPSDYFNHLTNSLERPDGSDEYIEDSPSFAQWLAPTHSQLRLQIVGESKTGKTSAALFIVEHLQRVQSSRSSKPQVLYFFCHRPYRQRNTASAVLKGWMYQLIEQRPDLMTELCACLLREPYYLHAYLNQPRVFWTFLRDAAKRSDAVMTYCVLDGLDECDNESKALLIELLTRTLPYEDCLETEPTLKILVTSRTQLGDRRFGVIELDKRTASSSALPSVHSSIEERSSNLEIGEKLLRSTALQVLAAYFHAPTTEQYLSFFKDSERDACLAYLKSCPAEVSVSPERIEFLDSGLWLSLFQTNVAAKFHRKLAEHQLSLIGAGLDQLRMEDLEQEDASVWMSQVSSELKYAVNHWANHVILSKDTSQDLMDLILKTFSTSLPTLEKWWTMFMTWNYGLSHHHDLRKHNTTPLHVFAMLGLSEILKTCDQDWIYDFTASQDAQGLDPLGLAILHDQFGMAEILGANQNFTQVFHCALATVSSVRVADMIFCKLDPRVHDLGMEAMKAMTWHACLTGEPALLESTTNFLFIKSSAGTFPWDIVTYANDTICSGDHRLLPKVLEMTSMKENAQQIIENAVAQHEPRMLEVILNYDVVQKMVQHGQIPLIDALNSALIRKCVPMSKLLLTKQTMNVQDGPGRRPLEYAVKYPNIHTLMLFLAQPEFAFDKGTIEEGVALNLMLHKAGVDVNIENLGKMLKRGARMRYEHFGMTALHVAAERGRTEVMKMLLETLADSEIKNDIDRTCGNCHKDQGRDGMTALAIASLKGYDEIVELLMNKGADAVVKDKDGKTAVQLARDAGWNDVVKVFQELKMG